MAHFSLEMTPKSKTAKVKKIHVSVEAKSVDEAIVLAKQTLLSGSRFVIKGE